MKTALIISGGEFSAPALDFKYDYVIACDKGYLYSEKLGIKPDLVIGDFDSFDGSIDKDIPVITMPVEKDDTDTMLAIKNAMEKGYIDIKIICGLGGRLDHLIANIQSLSFVASHGGTCEIIDETNRARTFSGGSLTLPAMDGYALSLFSLSDSCKNLTIRGAKYNAENITLTNTFPLGHGNHWEEKEITLSLGEGILLIVMSKIN